MSLPKNIRPAIAELLRRTCARLAAIPKTSKPSEARRLEALTALGSATEALRLADEATETVTREMLLLVAIESAELAAEIVSGVNGVDHD